MRGLQWAILMILLNMWTGRMRLKRGTKNANLHWFKYLSIKLVWDTKKSDSRDILVLQTVHVYDTLGAIKEACVTSLVSRE